MAGTQNALRQSLQFRLSAWIGALLLGVAVVAGAFSFITAFEEANELQDDTLRQIAALIDRNHLPDASASAPLREFASDSEVQVVVQTLPNASGKPSKLSAAPLMLPADLPDGLQTVIVDDESWRIFVTTLDADARFAVGQQTAVRDELARDGAMRTLMPFVILIPILLLVLRDVIRRMLKPMSELATELDGRSEQDLGALGATGLPTEVRPFVVAINRMLTRVEQSVSQQRRFLADAAHELRSPLTALSLQAERLAGTSMSDAALERLASLRQGIGRARLLLDQLLTLARVQDAPSAAATPVSVNKVFRQVIEELHPQAAAKAIDIGVISEQDARIAIAELDLTTLVRNLVDNAIKYTPAGGRVDLSVSAGEDGIVVRVSDSGPGIAPDERSRVLEPFHRLLGNDEIGSGLGLSIVKAIADRCGASVTLDYTDVARPAGLRVTVVFRGPSQDAGRVAQR